MTDDKLTRLLELAAVGLACLLLGALCSRGRQVQVPVLVTQQSGRYHVQEIGGTVWCTDTQTAETWFVKAGRWQRMRMPNDLVPHTTVEPVQEVQDSKFDPYSDEELERIANASNSTPVQPLSR